MKKISIMILLFACFAGTANALVYDADYYKDK
ncbi:unnamed protein product, partial [marine sediment metagenome]